MKLKELINFASSRGAHVENPNCRHYDDASLISINIGGFITDDKNKFKCWRDVIFVFGTDDEWQIGFSQAGKTRKLSDLETKKIIGKWIENPSNELLREYENTEF